MEISAQKTKLMTYDTSGINTEIKSRINEQKLETITSYKYLGSVLTGVPSLRYSPL